MENNKTASPTTEIQVLIPSIELENNMTTEPGNQFLITEPVENNTTTTEVAIHRLETPQKLGKKHNKNEKVF